MKKFFLLLSLLPTIFLGSCKKDAVNTPATDHNDTVQTRIIYAIRPDGALGWYRHLGYSDGTSRWVNNGQFKQVGEDWQLMHYAFRADSNYIYAIKPTGELGLYHHTGCTTGDRAGWAYNGQFRQVGEDWTQFTKVFSGGGNIIYAIKPNGDLGWYKHLGQGNGTASWANNGQFTKVGENWDGFTEVFSAGNGIIYAIKPNGDLGWYKHLGYADGTNSWAGTGQFKKVGEDWNTISHAFSGGGDIIYGIKPNGDLGWYKHLGQQDGLSSWANGGQFTRVGEDWSIFVNAF